MKNSRQKIRALARRKQLRILKKRRAEKLLALWIQNQKRL